MNSVPPFRFDSQVIMRKAIDLALQAQFQTEPNPMVGAILVDKTGEILAEGYHRKAGEPHAEVEALQAYQEVSADAILFVTLEPCNIQGKTPPCTDLLIKKNVKTVVIGTRDPNPKVSGRGIEILKSHGIRIYEGICETECRDLNRVFNKHISRQLPYITVKAAMSLDGKIAMASGESQWITGEQARNEGHRLRSQHQAIAVGHNTLITDNPRLTDRFSKEPRQPHRVVFSSRGEIPVQSHFMRQSETKRYLMTGNKIQAKLKQKLSAEGIKVLTGNTERPDVEWALRELYKLGVSSLLVEGGAELIASFIRERMVDQFYLFVSGKIIGNQAAPSWCAETGTEHLAQVPVLQFDRIEKLGQDLIITGYPEYR